MTTATALQTTLDTKLAELSAMSTPKPVMTQTEQFEKMITDMIEKKLAEIVPVATVAVEPEEELTVHEALGMILTGEEQKWFLNEEVIGQIPKFIVTENGKELAQQFFKGFRKYQNR